jgi:hypothetical protein
VSLRTSAYHVGLVLSALLVVGVTIARTMVRSQTACKPTAKGVHLGPPLLTTGPHVKAAPARAGRHLVSRAQSVLSQLSSTHRRRLAQRVIQVKVPLTTGLRASAALERRSPQEASAKTARILTLLMMLTRRAQSAALVVSQTPIEQPVWHALTFLTQVSMKSSTQLTPATESSVYHANFPTSLMALTSRAQDALLASSPMRAKQLACVAKA